MKKRVVIISLIILALLAGGIFALKQRSDTQTIETPSEVANVSEIPLSKDARDALAESINSMLASMEEVNQEYTIQYRENSTTKRETEVDTITSFIVDLPEIERTYKVRVFTSKSTAFESLYVECPEASELRYAEKPCEDTP